MSPLLVHHWRWANGRLTCKCDFLLAFWFWLLAFWLITSKKIWFPCSWRQYKVYYSHAKMLMYLFLCLLSGWLECSAVIFKKNYSRVLRTLTLLIVTEEPSFCLCRLYLLLFTVLEMKTKNMKNIVCF